MEKIPSGGIDDGSMSIRSQFPRRFLSTFNFPGVKVPLGASQLVVWRCRWDGGLRRWQRKVRGGKPQTTIHTTKPNHRGSDSPQSKATTQQVTRTSPASSFLLFFIAQSNPHNNSSQNYAKVEAASKWRTDKGEK
jgi:hypothetical protein